MGRGGHETRLEDHLLGVRRIIEPLARQEVSTPRASRIAVESHAWDLEEWMEANLDETAVFEDQSPFAQPTVILLAVQELVRVIERDDRERRGDPCAVKARRGGLTSTESSLAR